MCASKMEPRRSPRTLAREANEARIAELWPQLDRARLVYKEKIEAWMTRRDLDSWLDMRRAYDACFYLVWDMRDAGLDMAWPENPE